MKVVLVNHGTATEWGGGDSIQIKETAKRLTQRGHKVTIENKDRPEIKDADIVHIFNSRVYKSFSQQVSTCLYYGKPIVVSPIWISVGRALWGSRGTYGILKKAMKNNAEGTDQELEMLRTGELIVNLNGGTLDCYGNGSYDLKWQKDLSKDLKAINGLLTNSWLELKSVQRDLNWAGEKYGVANYGVDPKVFLDADPEIFRNYTGIKGEFILQAGRIEAGKNQAMLCWALRKTKIPIVLIGGTKHWPAYAELCKEISGDQLKIIDHLPQDILASAYAAARVHCLASWMDTCGLVSLEAGLNGVPLVGSTFGHELEYLKNDAWLADPGDPKGICNAVENAWDAGRYSEKSKKLKERIIEKYNWEKTTTATEEIYRDIIENA